MDDDVEVESGIEPEVAEATVDPFDMTEEQLDNYELDAAPEASEEESEDDSVDEEEDTTEEEIEPEELDDTEEEESEEAEPEEPVEIDYEAEYKKLMAPFKANGKEITTTSAEEVLQLKQMGANYNKKMHELKPHLKITNMLQKNNLLDEDKLNYLIDLSNKDPKAIAKLVKESGIDPLDIDTESEEYVPKNHTISEQEFKLNEVLGQIESTPTYNRTIDIVGNQWDNSSKDELSANPKMIAAINDHIANGVYDQIVAEIDKQQMFGGLEGLSDLDVYRKVGADLHKQGAFDEAKPEPVKRSKPKVKQSDAVRNLKKRAASPTKTTPKKAKVANKVNYFDLSEEELNNLPNTY